MARKKENKIVPITLSPYHVRKLRILCDRTGLSKTGVIQRLIEHHDVFDFEGAPEGAPKRD